MKDAACRDEDPEVFFPVGSPGNDAYDAQVSEAKSICHRCTVASDCLARVLRTRDSDSVSGGMTPDERRNLRERRNKGLVLTP
jgi:WhiB family redox-sensing transcriptional regulator